ncbi:hypothetical protein TNCV_1043711 [Trichonephila clavipes]|nr:hypothetical protein TNCV_1043711 [Trichonephila clavipes]
MQFAGFELKDAFAESSDSSRIPLFPAQHPSAPYEKRSQVRSAVRVHIIRQSQTETLHSDFISKDVDVTSKDAEVLWLAESKSVTRLQRRV